MVFGNGVKSIQAAAYNGARTVNLFQKHLFLYKQTHNMIKDCSLNYEFSTWKFQAQNMLRTCCVHKLFIVYCFCFDMQPPVYYSRLYGISITRLIKSVCLLMATSKLLSPIVHFIISLSRFHSSQIITCWAYCTQVCILPKNLSYLS